MRDWYDVAIVGGGVAGAALGGVLASAGLGVVVGVIADVSGAAVPGERSVQTVAGLTAAALVVANGRLAAGA